MIRQDKGRRCNKAKAALRFYGLLSNLGLSAHRNRTAQRYPSETETTCRLRNRGRRGKDKCRTRQIRASFPFLIHRYISYV